MFTCTDKKIENFFNNELSTYKFLCKFPKGKLSDFINKKTYVDKPEINEFLSEIFDQNEIALKEVDGIYIFNVMDCNFAVIHSDIIDEVDTNISDSDFNYFNDELTNIFGDDTDFSDEISDESFQKFMEVVNQIGVMYSRK